MQETINSANVATSILFLGHDGEWWDFGLIVSVIAAALVATAIGVTTAGSIVAHKREARSAEDALERFKIEMVERLAEANARTEEANRKAVEAQLTLERFKQPRSLSPDQVMLFVSSLLPYAGTKIDIWLNEGSQEVDSFGRSLAVFLNMSKWQVNTWILSAVGGSTGVAIVIKEGADPKIAEAARILSSALSNAGVDNAILPWVGDWMKSGILNGSTPFTAEIAAPIRIVVGEKPQR